MESFLFYGVGKSDEGKYFAIDEAQIKITKDINKFLSTNKKLICINLILKEIVYEGETCICDMYAVLYYERII